MFVVMDLAPVLDNLNAFIKEATRENSAGGVKFIGQRIRSALILESV